MLLRKKMLAMLGVSLFAAGAANAGTTFPYDPDGLGPLTISSPAPAVPPNLLGGLDWSVGNTVSVFDVNLATRTVVNNSVLRVGDTFTTYYQAKLTRFQDNSPSGTSTLFTGGPGIIGQVNGDNSLFNNDFEWTVTARFRERVVAIDASGEATFAVIDDQALAGRPNYFRVFFDAANDATNVLNGGGAGVAANDQTGDGFGDGLLILEARGGTGTGDFRPDGVVSQFDQFLGASGIWAGDFDPIAPGVQPYSTIQGSGDFVADADITFFNPNFFSFPALLPGTFRIVEHDTDQELPFDNAQPSEKFLDDAAFINSQFAVGAPEYFLSFVNGAPVAGQTNWNAIQFEADADSSFDIASNVVPEPATAAMGLMGLAGLLMGRRRKA